MSCLFRDDREFLEKAKASPAVEVNPHSTQIQELFRDGLITLHAVITGKGKEALKQERKRLKREGRL